MRYREVVKRKKKDENRWKEKKRDEKRWKKIRKKNYRNSWGNHLKRIALLEVCSDSIISGKQWNEKAINRKYLKISTNEKCTMKKQKYEYKCWGLEEHNWTIEWWEGNPGVLGECLSGGQVLMFCFRFSFFCYDFCARLSRLFIISRWCLARLVRKKSGKNR